MPKVENVFATIGKRDVVFLCERYSRTESPQLIKIVEIESSVSMEAVVSFEVVWTYHHWLVNTLMILWCKGYRLTLCDWVSHFIDFVKANEAIAHRNLRFSFSEDECSEDGCSEDGREAIAWLKEELKEVKAELKEVKAKVATLEEKSSNNYHEDVHKIGELRKTMVHKELRLHRNKKKMKKIM